MAESRGGRTWLAYGCLGCLGLVGVCVLLVAGLMGTAWLGVKSEQVEDRVITPEIPDAAPAEAEDRPAEEPATQKAGEVILHLSDGEFHVEPADPGEPLRVEARYDKKSYELVEALENQDESWRYELRFRRTTSSFMGLFQALLGGTSPRVDIFLPPGLPLKLTLDLNRGGSEVELGGLWLTSADIGFSQGGFEIGVAEPLQEPMDRLAIHGSMGGFSAQRIGNASPRELDVDFKMGGMELDLRGQWVRDADVSIAFGMGGGEVQLPKDALIVGLDDKERVAVPRQPEIRLPTLTFSVSGDRENLQIVD